MMHMTHSSQKYELLDAVKIRWGHRFVLAIVLANFFFIVAGLLLTWNEIDGLAFWDYFLLSGQFIFWAVLLFLIYLGIKLARYVFVVLTLLTFLTNILGHIAMVARDGLTLQTVFILSATVTMVVSAIFLFNSEKIRMYWRSLDEGPLLGEDKREVSTKRQ